jgi:hypothetical protein
VFVCPSRLIESDGVGSLFSSVGDRLGLELTDQAVTVGSLRESSDLKPDIVYVVLKNISAGSKLF